MVILILVQFGNLAATEDLPSVFYDFLTGYIPQLTRPSFRITEFFN